MVNIKQNIKLAFVDNKYLLLVSTVLFIVTLLAGYFLHSYLYSYLNPAVEQLSKDVSSGTISFTFQTIFLNNIMIVFKLFIFAVLFCFSFVILAYNGFFLGYFIANYNNLVTVLLLVVPHGIFELPSIIIANTAGLVLFKFVFRVITLKNSKSKNDELIEDNSYLNKLSISFVNNSNYLKESLILLGISVILMIIAGVIEVYVTKNLAFFLMNILGLK